MGHAVMRKAAVRLEQIGLESMEERIWDSPRGGVEVGINLNGLVCSVKIRMYGIWSPEFESWTLLIMFLGTFIRLESSYNTGSIIVVSQYLGGSGVECLSHCLVCD